MVRRLVRPYGQAVPGMRILSLLFALAVLWMLYERMRDPQTWRWLAEADGQPAVPAPAALPPAAPAPENIVPGSNDLDPATLAEFREKLEFISDGEELRAREMPLYWELMRWSRAEPFQQLERRAIPDPAFRQLWSEPKKYRGRPIRLRMHVKQVVKWDEVAENDIGVDTVYEVWGWTDDSKSFPYLVVVPELPPGIRTGTNVDGEVVFVGYFLKIMKYEAFDAKRGAPLLIGRMRLAAPRPAPKPVASDPLTGILLGALALIMAAAAYGWYALNARRKPPASVLPADLSSLAPIDGVLAGDQSLVVLPPRTESAAAEPPPPNVFAMLDLEGNKDAP